LTRPIVEAGEELGFLPGTFEEKVAPYMQPLYEAIEVVKGSELVPKWHLTLNHIQSQISPNTERKKSVRVSRCTAL
jgi:phosphate starvation-inducible protein PhoH